MAFAVLPMDGTPSLKAFADEVGYLCNQVYNNPLVSVDSADPPQNDGRRHWFQLGKFIEGLPDTPIRFGLLSSYAHVLRTMPPDVETGNTILSNMRTTAMALREILQSHGKDNPDKPDKTFQEPHSWLQPEILALGPKDLKSYPGPVDGHAVRLGKQFYERHRESLGLEALDMDQMQSLMEQEGAVGRVAKVNGTTLGFYICQRRGEILEVLEWVMSTHLAASERGVPEKMIVDTMYDLSPFSIRTPKITTIKSAIARTHAKVSDAPLQGSWRDRTPLF